MNRYWLFGGEQHYACGGFHDLIFTRDNLQEIADFCAQYKDKRMPDKGYLDWWHVFDSETQAIVLTSEYGAYGSERAEPMLSK